MRHALSLRIWGVALGCVAMLGCQKSFWVASPDLAQARRIQPATASENIAIHASERPGGGEAVYVRAATATLAESGLGPNEPYTKINIPNKGGKKIGGAVLTGIGGVMVVGAFAMIGYGVSIRGRDSLGAGIIGGFSGLPLGIGIPLVISGGVLLGRSGGLSDIVQPEQRGITYVEGTSAP